MFTALLSPLTRLAPERLFGPLARPGRRALQLAPGIWIVRTSEWVGVAAFDHHGDVTTIDELIEGNSKATLLLQPPEWQDYAICAGMGWGTFYGTGPQMQRSEINVARQVCLGCPVARECLTWALEQKERHGVWGGTYALQRDRMQAVHQDGVPIHAIVGDWLATWPAP